MMTSCLLVKIPHQRLSKLLKFNDVRMFLQDTSNKQHRCIISQINNRYTVLSFMEYSERERRKREGLGGGGVHAYKIILTIINYCRMQ